MSVSGRLSAFGLAVVACLVTSATPKQPHLAHPSDHAAFSALIEPAPALMKPTVVTVTARPVRHPVPLGQALVPAGHGTIGHQLQEELRRVGCYAGEVNGEWTTSTRRAMQEFMQRVNAVLPIEQPDGILLALVQGHQGKVCGAPCPAGQVLSSDRQCVPNAILAMAEREKIAAANGKRSAVTLSTWTVQTTLAGQPPATEPPGDVSAVAPAAATAPEPPRRRVAAKPWRSLGARRERSWASALFRFSVN
jgi:hypothetical protein